MSSREESAARARPVSLNEAAPGVVLRVIAIVRPKGLADAMWRTTQARLEELGVFKGQKVERAGDLGRAGAVIVKAGGSRVALSRDIAGAVIVAR